MTRHRSRPGTAAMPRPAGVVRVVTRNVYVGALFDSILAAPSSSVLAERVDSAWRAVLDSSFPERARVLARETAAADPDVIALQEVARLTARAAGASREGALLDYLELLLAELARHGLACEAAAVCQAADAELPTRSGSSVRLSVRNVLLVRQGVRVSGVASSCFEANLSAMAGGEQGVPITVLRGWAAANIEVGGHAVRVVNTHFETQPTPGIQRAQCEELLRILEPIRGPLIVMGDLNSDALGGDTATYRMLVDSGLADAWRLARDDDGCTCCHSPDLRDPASPLTKRIDHILVRGPLTVLSADLVGAGDDSRTESGLWASDHAGVVADILVR